MRPVLMVSLLDGQRDHGEDFDCLPLAHSCSSLRQLFFERATLHPLAYHRVLETTKLILFCREVVSDGEEIRMDHILEL